MGQVYAPGKGRDRVARQEDNLLPGQDGFLYRRGSDAAILVRQGKIQLQTQIVLQEITHGPHTHDPSSPAATESAGVSAGASTKRR
jgi:hypothetical protein